MKKLHLDHILRAAGRITGQKEFVIIGSQALHGKHPDLVDEIVNSAEADLIAGSDSSRTEWLNVIGQDSPFHEQFGYYADPVEEGTAILPTGWRARLVTLAPGNTEGVKGKCLEPHDLAIAKYVAGREKDLLFNRQLAQRGITERDRLLDLLEKTPIPPETRERIRGAIRRDFSKNENAGSP